MEGRQVSAKAAHVPTRAEAALDTALYLAPFAAACLVIAHMLRFAGHGLDITDEGFYLNWLADPFLYRASATQFGFVYHPLHLLLGGDIALLRAANVLLTWGLAWAMTHVLLRGVVAGEGAGRWRRASIAAGMATTALAVFNVWLVTPSYNSLAVQGMLVMVTGVALVHHGPGGRSASGCVLLGVGAWVLFMAKPTTLVTTSLLLGAHLMLARRLHPASILLAAGVMLLLTLVSALAIDGSVTLFMERLRTGAAELQLLDPQYEPARLFKRFRIFIPDRALAFWSVVLLGLLFITARGTGRWSAQRSFVGTLPVAVLLFLVIAMVAGGLTIPKLTGRFQGMLFLVFPVAMLFGTDRYALRTAGGGRISLAIVLLLLPLAYSFGSNTDYWRTGIYAGTFWALAGVPLLPRHGGSRLPLASALAMALVAAVLVTHATRTPYRQPGPLRDNTVVMEVGPARSVLRLHPEIATQLQAAVSAGQGAGLVAGTPVIDLSGRSPTLVYAMEGIPIGQAWILGSYPGSCAWAGIAMARVACDDLARAWLIDGPGDPKRICPELLHSFGADLDRDYAVVGEWPARDPDAHGPVFHVHRLLKPLRPIAIAAVACTDQR